MLVTHGHFFSPSITPSSNWEETRVHHHMYRDRCQANCASSLTLLWLSQLSLQYTNLALEFFVLPLIYLEVADQDVDAALFVDEFFFEASLLGHEVCVSNLPDEDDEDDEDARDFLKCLLVRQTRST